MKKLICLALCLLLLPLPVRAEETPAVPEPSVTEAPAVTEHTHTWSEARVEATCTQAGSVTKTCSGCGETATEAIPAAGHSFGGLTDNGDGTHSRSCSVCAAPETAAHSWGEGSVTVQPSCTATGTKVYTCGCGAQKSETLPVMDHAYGEWTVSEETHSHSCSCGKTESGPHSWDVSATVPPTCLEEGATAYLCSTCGAVAYEVLPKLTTHTYDNVCDPDCNICGAVRDASHNFSAAWSRNSKGHWHACVACGAESDFGNHYPGPAATEEKAQICLTCGITLTPKLGHKHKFAAQWSSDETGHWYACSGCEEVQSFAGHTYDDGCDPDCNVCGFVTATAHVYSGTWLSDETGHWDVCTICDEKGIPEPHIPGDEATEDTPQLCLICGFELAPAAEHVHTGEGEWLHDGENHWQLCACGETTKVTPHLWDAGQEQEDTTILYTCLDCGETRLEGEPETGLPWQLIALGAVIVICVVAALVLVLLMLRKKPGKYDA